MGEGGWIHPSAAIKLEGFNKHSHDLNSLIFVCEERDLRMVVPKALH